MIIILIIIIGCDKVEKNTFSSNIQIVTKYITLDEKLSPNHSKCSDEVKGYKEMGKYDCSFQVEGLEFDIEEKYLLDDNGNIKEYWTFKSEGPLTYKVEELKSDPKFLKSIGGAKLNIKLLENRKQIMDKGDTMTIERIFQEEKLILIMKKASTKRTDRRILLEYK